MAFSFKYEDEELVNSTGWKKYIDLETGSVGVYCSERKFFSGCDFYDIKVQNGRVFCYKNAYHLNFSGSKCVEVYEIVTEQGVDKLQKAEFYIDKNYINLYENSLVNGTQWKRVQNLDTKCFGVYDPVSDDIICPVVSPNLYRANDGNAYMLNQEQDKWYILESVNGKLSKRLFANQNGESGRQK